MEVAGRDAAVPAVGKRFVGGSDGPADETDGARAALPVPEACLYRKHLVALHGFIKKTRTTPGGGHGWAPRDDRAGVRQGKNRRAPPQPAPSPSRAILALSHLE